MAGSLRLWHASTKQQTQLTSKYAAQSGSTDMCSKKIMASISIPDKIH
jgi:hypothetical protein